jgi:hypothetical protein
MHTLVEKYAAFRARTGDFENNNLDLSAPLEVRDETKLFAPFCSLFRPRTVLKLANDCEIPMLDTFGLWTMIFSVSNAGYCWNPIFAMYIVLIVTFFPAPTAMTGPNLIPRIQH